MWFEPTPFFEPTTIGLILFAYLWAGLVKGITGIGYSTNCLPILVLAVGLKPALSLLVIPSICSNLVIMHKTTDFTVSLKRFKNLFLTLLPGLALGLSILVWIDGHLAGAFLGVVLISFSCFSLVNPNWHLAAKLEQPLMIPTGFLTGLINGITGSQVTPICPYLLALNVPRSIFIQTSNISFTLSSLIMIAGLKIIGILNLTALLVSLIGIIITFAGINLGNQLGQKFAPLIFRHAVFVVLILAGFILIFKYFALRS